MNDVILKKDKNMFPQWYPEGYKLIDVDIYRINSSMVQYETTYYNKDLVTYISSSCTTSDHKKHALTHIVEFDDVYNIYHAKNIPHYFFLQDKMFIIFWFTNNGVCQIYGKFTFDEGAKMIDSMYQNYESSD